MVKFQKIDYSNLNNKSKEAFNFQKIGSVFADYGYELSWLKSDSHKADFLATHFQTGETLSIQLKSRLTIMKKYQDAENLYIAFPAKDDGWYLIKHDELIELTARASNKDPLDTTSWENGYYHRPQISKSIERELQNYLLT